MMRIAIAGGGCLGRLLASHLSQTPHSLIVLSRLDRSAEFAPYDCQVVVAYYGDIVSLSYTLRGVDLVISTVSGVEQLNLIEAARRVGVRRFVPSEFEGTVRGRPPAGRDPLDLRSSGAALEVLREMARAGAPSSSTSPSPSSASPMQYTVFTCGVFYERFGPGGLGAYGMGFGMGVPGPGDFLVDVGAGTADVVEEDAAGQPIGLCLTTMDDAARFVAAAVEATGVEGTAGWPTEYRMRGDQLTVRELVGVCETVREVPFVIHRRRPAELEAHLLHFSTEENLVGWNYTQRLVAVAKGRYSFQTNLNELMDGSGGGPVRVRPVDFRTWMGLQWGGGA